MTVPMVAAEVARERLPGPAETEPPPPRLPLSVIREMLVMLDNLTIAGQRHLMEKVVHFVEEQVPRLATSVSRRNHAAVATILEELHHESDRLVPDVAAFSRGAESLLALLAALE
jgi:hypothetical protein